MRLYILDWGGTLSSLTTPDPWTFVKALQKRGDLVLLWTGGWQMGCKYSEGVFKLVSSTVDAYSSKGSLREIFQAVGHHPENYWTFDIQFDSTGITEVVLSDDEYEPYKGELEGYAAYAPNVTSVRFVKPQDLVKELER